MNDVKRKALPLEDARQRLRRLRKKKEEQKQKQRHKETRRTGWLAGWLCPTGGDGHGGGPAGAQALNPPWLA
jgi:hypothetical protein